MSKNEPKQKEQSSKSDSAGKSQSTQGSQGSANTNDGTVSLDRAIAEKRVYPAVDVAKSNSRK